MTTTRLTTDKTPTENNDALTVPAAEASNHKNNLISNIPTELRVHTNFLWWQLTPGENGALKKLPYNPTTGTFAKCDDESTWTDFDTARAAVESVLYESIGFALTSKVGLAIVDFDKVRESAGVRTCMLRLGRR